MHKPKIKIEYCYCDECMKEEEKEIEKIEEEKSNMNYELIEEIYFD